MKCKCYTVYYIRTIDGVPSICAYGEGEVSRTMAETYVIQLEQLSMYYLVIEGGNEVSPKIEREVTIVGCAIA